MGAAERFESAGEESFTSSSSSTFSSSQSKITGVKGREEKKEERSKSREEGRMEGKEEGEAGGESKMGMSNETTSIVTSKSTSPLVHWEEGEEGEFEGESTK